MLEEIAKVTAISGNNVTVESTVKSTCSSCHQADDCGSGLVAKAIPHKTLSMTIQSQTKLAVGDCVIIAIPQTYVMHSAWQVYALPLIGLILFGFVGQRLVESAIYAYEFLAILTAFFGGVLGFLLAKKLQNRTKSQQNLQPRIVKVLPETISVTEISS